MDTKHSKEELFTLSRVISKKIIPKPQPIESIDQPSKTMKLT
jgi:hypothetical protein